MKIIELQNTFGVKEHTQLCTNDKELAQTCGMFVGLEPT